MLVGLGLHGDARTRVCVCCWWSRGVSNTAHARAEDSPPLTVCSVVTNHIQAIVFYVLAQTKVLYLHIYISLLTKCLKIVPRNTRICNK